MDAPDDQSAIRVRDLMVGFGKQVVLDHLSLDVRRGEILGLVGASGGGKSVLLRTIIGLLAKRSGSIEVIGMDLERADAARGAGDRPALGHPVSAGRAVLLAYRSSERAVSDAREPRICPIGCSTNSPTPSSKWSA